MWRAWRNALAVVALLLAVGACGGGPKPPAEDYDVAGKVVLPPGSPLDPASLQVLSSNGFSGVGGDGSFSVPVGVDGTALVALADADGRLALMGFLGTHDDGAELSSRSTAAALLYMALAGQFREPEVQEFMLEALATEPEVDALASDLGETLAADPLALADGSDALVTAVMDARERIIARDVGESAGPTAVVGAGLAAAGLGPAAADENYVVILDPGEKAGLDALLADSGTGVYVKSSKRRPARLLVYETGVKVGDGPVIDLSPAPVGTYLVIPPSNSLEFTATLGAIASGDYMNAPLAPSYSEPIELPLKGGTTRTYYTAVALAPSLSSELPAIFTDSRFFGQRSFWDRQLLELGFETFWSNLLLPVVANVGLGVAVTKADYGALQASALNVMGIVTPLLDPAAAANPMAGDRAKTLVQLIERAALEESADVYWALIENARNSLGAASRAVAPGYDARAFARALASAGGVLRVVSLIVTGADVVAVVSDMTSNPPGASWDLVRTEVSAKIVPQQGQVGRVEPSAAFDVVIDQPLDGGTYVYRWSTSGEYGYLYDYVGQEGESIETTRSSVLYVANAPNAITDDLRDTITVEVYRDDGSGTVPAGAPLVAQATATVVGKEKQDVFRGRWFYDSGLYTTPSGDERVCQGIWVGIKLVTGGKTYSATGSNFYDPFYFGSSLHVGYYDGQYIPPVTDDYPCPQQRIRDGEYQYGITGGDGPASGGTSPGWFEARFEGMIVEVVVTY